jgi:subtilisin family serine protease
MMLAILRFFVCVLALATMGAAAQIQSGKPVKRSDNAQGTNAVIIVLRTQPDVKMMRTIRESYGPSLQSALADLKAAAETQLANEPRLARAQAMADRLEVEARRAMNRAVEKQCGPERDAFLSRLEGVGATHVHAYRSMNAVAARIPAAALRALEEDEAVAEIVLDGVLYGQLDVSAVTLGTPAFWDVGLTGSGQSIALIDSGVDRTHPALAGATIIDGPVFSSQWFLLHHDNPTSPDDYTIAGHGTQMAGILVSQGSPGYPRHWGVARGATLFNLKAAFESGTESPGIPRTLLTYSAMLAALDYVVTDTPAKIVNISYAEGGTSTSSGAAAARLVDLAIANYDIAVVVGFPDVFDPYVAHNTIAVGAMDDRNTVSRLDDMPLPTPPSPNYTGERKPDLTAPGINIMTTANHWEGGQPDFTAIPGVPTFYPIAPNTFAVIHSPSAAAAHVSGALALLRQIGITDMLVAKAVLINSADGQSWAADQGYGSLDLWKAKTPGSYFSRDLNPGSNMKYFSSQVNSGAIDVTVVKTRLPGFYGAPFTIYDRRTGMVAYRDSGQWVQKHSLPNGHYVIALFDEGVVDWAIAVSRRGFDEVMPASLSARCWGDPVVKQGSKYFVTCAVTNQGDLENQVWGDAGVAPNGSGAANCVIDFGRVAGHSTRTQSCQVTAGAPGLTETCVRLRAGRDYVAQPIVQPEVACYATNVLP